MGSLVKRDSRSLGIERQTFPGMMVWTFNGPFIGPLREQLPIC